MRTRISILAISAIAVVLTAAGCGNDSEAAVTKRSFIKQADAICAKQKQKLEAGRSDNIRKEVEEEVATLAEQVSEIESLDIPAGDEQQVQAMLRSANKAVDLIGPDLSGSRTASVELARAEEQAEDYGLRECFIA